VYNSGQWGTVCDDLWDDEDAAVVCRSLGYNLGGRAVGSAYFGQGAEPTWMDDVSCVGNEPSLNLCSFPGFGVENCAHSEDAGVICNLDTGIKSIIIFVSITISFMQTQQ